MQATLARYRSQIQSGRIRPLKRWDGVTSGILFDPVDERTPLAMLAFGAYRLDDGPFEIATGDREYALVPIDARFEVQVAGKTFRGHRRGGPFAALPDSSNASAVYVPRDVTFTIRGTREMVLFSAPARGDKPPALVGPAERENLRRGTATWHRDVITVFTPEDVTTHLIGGETYSPPGLWSGTPLHVHDRDDLTAGQSDHEEVYYHVARVTEGQWGAYGVQLLFDDAGLDQAYMIHHRHAMAIPGAAHPVVAGPMSDMLYVWALAGQSDQLAMLDIPEFAYLKGVGEIIDQLEAERPREPVARAAIDALACEHGLDAAAKIMLRLHLRERGIVCA